MDHDRFRTRARELRATADEVSCLTALPDDITAPIASRHKLKTTVELLRDAAFDIEQLVGAKPTGCTCRRIQDENAYDYLDYAEGCLHHHELYQIRAHLKEEYVKMERVLKNEVRLRLITAALSGTARMPDDDDVLVKRAIAIADEALDRIAREALYENGIS